VSTSPAWTFPADPFLAPDGETFEDVVESAATFARDAREARRAVLDAARDAALGTTLATLYGQARADALLALDPPF
jgi:hypothetical protein